MTSWIFNILRVEFQRNCRNKQAFVLHQTGEWCGVKLACISVESQMFLRPGKRLRSPAASSMYLSKPDTTISQALSPILTCMLRRGLGIYGLWSDHTSRLTSDSVFPVLMSCNRGIFLLAVLEKNSIRDSQITWWLSLTEPAVDQHHSEHFQEPTLMPAHRMQNA